MIKPFQKLLVPVDFSVHSHNALDVAADVSRRYEAPITVMHVWEPELFSVPESYRLYDPSHMPRMLDELTQALEKARHDLHAAGVMHVDTALVQGSALSEILRFTQDGHYDLIVMGTHGRTGLAHALMGSVAERVVRKAPCAVMTVRMQPQATAQQPATGARIPA